MRALLIVITVIVLTVLSTYITTFAAGYRERAVL